MKKQLLNILFSLALVMGLMLGVSQAVYADDPQPQDTKYLTFTGEEYFELSIKGNTKLWDDEGIMQYSTNKEVWTEWDGKNAISSAQSSQSAPFVLYLRGRNNKKVSGDWNKYFQLSAPVACSGNIMSLLDYENPGTELEVESTFTYLFKNCSNLTSAPALPATKLTYKCYQYMFAGCTGLTSAPALPAKTMAERCYNYMFYGCTGLSNAPALEAKTLAEYCYADMFEGCTSLSSAPALPATTLAGNCYNNMFYGCTGLSSAPALKAKTMKPYCYESMFRECTNLASAPELPATNLAKNCYGNMFNGCTSLKNAPALSATTLADGCYTYMFAGCTGLSSGPILPATTLADNCYICMFSNCSGLKNAPALPATTLAYYCYAAMFAGCTGLSSAPALPATTLTEYCYGAMFNRCTGLSTAPALPATTLAKSCYSSMFQGCTGLTSVPALPATTLTDSCYFNMFQGCTGLTSVPALPATTLAESCYSNMFHGCTGIRVSDEKGTFEDVTYDIPYRIPTEGTATDVNGFSSYMFSRTGGKFTGNPAVNTRYYLSGSYRTISFDANGGDGTMDSQSVLSNTGTYLNANNTITRNGYNFIGWNTAADGSGTAYEDQGTITLTQDQTLYAQWEKKHKHKFGAGDSEDTEFTAWKKADSLPADAGNYYLTQDVTIDYTWVPANGIHLCLNGYGIRYTGSTGSVIKLENKALYMCDCHRDREHYITLSSWRGTAVSDTGTESDATDGNGVVKVKGGYITGGNGSYGGTYMKNSSLTIYGGTLIGNVAFGIGTSSYGQGGAIGGNGNSNGASSNMTLDGTSIIYNWARRNDGSGATRFSGKISLNDATIENNYGGGLTVLHEDMTVSGATVIRYNYVKDANGGKYEQNLVIEGKQVIAENLGEHAYIGIYGNMENKKVDPTNPIMDKAYAAYKDRLHADRADCRIGINEGGHVILGEAKTVTYNTDNVAAAPDPDTVAQNSVMCLPAPDPADSFVGWVDSGDATETLHPAGESFVVSADTTLNARWSITLSNGQKPTAKTNLKYTGLAQALVNAPAQDLPDGTAGIQYAPGTDRTTVPTTGWSAQISTGTDTGIYYVWYKVTGDSNHIDTEPSCIEVKIHENKDMLAEAIADTENYRDKISEYDFYADAVNDLNGAINDAKTISAKEDAIQQEINDAIDALNDAVTAAKNAVVTALVEEIKELPAKITDKNKDEVEAIEKAYDELNDSQKIAVDKKLSKDVLTKLSDMEKAAEVADMIGILPDIGNITEKDEAKVATVRLAYDVLTDSQKALIGEDILEKLEASEEKLADLDEQNSLAAAIASAISRLKDYSEAKAIPFETAAEQDAYDKAVNDGEADIRTAGAQKEVAAKLKDAKAAVDTALAKIKQDRADAAAAAEAMAAADKALADAKAAAGTAKTAADEAAKDPYASDADKVAIEDAKAALESAVAAADGLPDDATARQKNDAATAIADAVNELNAVTDTANVHSAAARAAAEEEATAAQQLQAARDSATDRLDDYSEAKAKADFTAGEQAAYDKAVNDGKTAIGNAKNKEEVASALTEAKTAVDNALKKIEQDRADAAAAAEEMAAADKAVEDAGKAAAAAKAAADKAAADIYASDADKQAINDKKAAVDDKINAADQLPDDATAKQKSDAAKAIEHAVDELNAATDDANIHSAAVRAEAEEAATAAQQLKAARDSATERLEDYSEAKAKSDFTAEEKAAYDKAVNDGKTAIGNAKNKEEVAIALTDAKTAVDNALKKIEQDRADAAAAAEEMAAADKAVADAEAAAGTAKTAAEEAAKDPYASDADKQAINDAKAEVDSKINAADQLPDDATARQKEAAAKAIEDAVETLNEATDKANVNSAAVRAAAEGAATAAQQLQAAKDSATERLDDYSEAKAKADLTAEEKAAYDKAVNDGKTAIGNAKNKEEVAGALTDAKAAVDNALKKIEQDRTDAAAAAEEMAAADKAVEDAGKAAATAETAADKAAADIYASDADKEAIEDAKAALESAVAAADGLPDNATAKQKNDAAKAIEDAVGALEAATDAANVNSAAAKAAAQESAAEAKQLAAARTYAIGRLEDYSDTKALADMTEEEQAAYDKAVAEGIEAIKKAEDEDAIADALKEAKKAVSEALSKIKKDRADAEAAAKEKAAADKAEADAKKAADEAARKAAEEAAKKAAEAEAAASAQAAMENKLSIDSKLKVSQKGSKAVVAWGKVKDADHYIVYGGYCNKKAKKLKTVKAGAPATVNITKLNGKKLDLTKNYMFYVAAYKTVNGKKVKLCKTLVAHIVGRKNTTFTNIKNIKLKTKRMNLTVGKSRKIKAKLVLVDPKKKMLSKKHAPKFRYATSDDNVATVSKKGKVTARGKGQCYIWVYAKNGFARKTKVIVE